MIAKLKRKLILTNVLMVAVVLIAAFAAMYIITKSNLADRSITAMHSISASYKQRSMPRYASEVFEDGQYSYLKAITIETNDTAMTFTINGYDVDDNEITEDELSYLNRLIKAAYAVDEPEGVLKSQNLRYYKVKTLLGYRIVFVDKEYEDTVLSDLITLFAFSALVILGIVSGISILFAYWSVEPVSKSIRQQKQLISDVSHELKTPITVISANADIISSHPDSTVSEQIKWVDYIKAETNRMSALIANMLYLAKQDEATSNDDHKVLCFSDIVYEAALPFESVCYEKHKHLDINVEQNVYIKGNETSLKQLVAILVDNACKYSAENGNVKVSLISYQDKVDLSVWNTGEPIPEQSLPHLFDRFYRIDKSRSRADGGYGLGLSIAKSITEMHGGRIWVNSNIQNGTTFGCTFKKSKPLSK